MDSQTPPMGSFGAAIGGGSPVMDAMARRGIDASILNQVSPASPNFQPMPQPPQGQFQMPQGAPPQGAPGQVPGQPTGQPMGQPTVPPPGTNPETQMILQALAERLKHHSKVEKGVFGGA